MPLPDPNSAKCSPTTRILVVDNDPDACEAILEWLREGGYHELETAENGLDAIERLRRATFDLVITDMRMPRMDGLGLLNAIEQAYPGLPVIFLSGEATISEAVAAMRGGRAFDFLEKPLHNGRLLIRVVDQALALNPLPTPAFSEHPVVLAVVSYIRGHYAEPLSLNRVAEAMGYSPAYLSELMRENTGLTVPRWLVAIRMEEAKRLMREGAMPMSEIGRAVGFNDVSHFVRRFRQATGMTPAAWRDAHVK